MAYSERLLLYLLFYDNLFRTISAIRFNLFIFFKKINSSTTTIRTRGRTLFHATLDSNSFP
jgi:hypothetical protein